MPLPERGAILCRINFQALSLDWGKRLLNYRQVALIAYKGLKEGTEEIYLDKYAAEFSLSLKAIAVVERQNSDEDLATYLRGASHG